LLVNVRSRYNSLVSLFNNRTFAIVDVETTGGSPAYDRIIDIGIIRIENGKEVDRFTSLIQPDRALSQTIEAITGIRNVDLEGAPRFEDISGRIHDLLDGAIFVAHNARFDYGFLKSELKRIEVPWKAKCLCSVKLSRKFYPQTRRHNLDAVMSYHNISCETRHRALPDAIVVYDFLKKICQDHDEEHITKHVNGILAEHTFPQHINEKSVRDLPDTPGVYFFQGEQGEILYVGKSKNIRTRVMSHFAGDYQTGKEMKMCQETYKIEYEETAGELGALLLESHLIKSLEPEYNRLSRRKKKIMIARKKARSDGYLTVGCEYVDFIDPQKFESIVAIFKSTSSAQKSLRKTAAEYGLCEKLLGLESGRGSCFKYHLGQCGGACVGRDDVKTYNKKLDAAFKKKKLRSWPFPGPVIIEERGEEYTDAFVIDGWTLIRALRERNNSYEEFLSKQSQFDYDTYKIVARHLLDKKNRKNISTLSSHDMRSMAALTGLENVE
jgi:DNA polymerase III subunit epsilon